MDLTLTSIIFESHADVMNYYYYNLLPVNRRVLAYCSVHIIEKELNDYKHHWNSHKVRHNSKSSLPCGIPSDLFDMPKNYGDLIYMFQLV